MVRRSANVVKTDIATTNGVIHVIDSVILPQAISSPPSEPGFPQPRPPSFDNQLSTRGIGQRQNQVEWIHPKETVPASLSLLCSNEPVQLRYWVFVSFCCYADPGSDCVRQLLAA